MNRVLLVTSWDQPQCGIQAHSEQLIQWVQAADPKIQVQPSAEALDPHHDEIRSLIHDVVVSGIDIVHFNYHRALHSRWTPHEIARLKESYKVVITMHDTFGESEPDVLSKDLHDLADAFIVHEPCVGLPQAIYWRQGVPEPDGRMGEQSPYYLSRPILSTVGFDFGWKNFSEMAKVAASVGWGLTIFTPEMPAERQAELEAINPWLWVKRNADTQDVIAGLAQCDATAFLYVCGNSGTSAAIRLGIAARKPVLALSPCRQFRDLLADQYASEAISWHRSFESVQSWLRSARLGRFHTPMVALAEQDSWRHLGKKYADLYRSLA